MDWKRMLDSAKVPVVAVIVLIIIFLSSLSSFTQKIIIGNTIYEMRGYISFLALFLAPFIALFAGYRTVKNFKYDLLGAAVNGFLVGLVVSAVLMVISFFVISGFHDIGGSTTAGSPGIGYLLITIAAFIAVVMLPIFGAILGLAGGFAAQKNSKIITLFIVFFVIVGAYLLANRAFPISFNLNFLNEKKPLTVKVYDKSNNAILADAEVELYNRTVVFIDAHLGYGPQSQYGLVEVKKYTDNTGFVSFGDVSDGAQIWVYKRFYDPLLIDVSPYSGDVKVYLSHCSDAGCLLEEWAEDLGSQLPDIKVVVKGGPRYGDYTELAGATVKVYNSTRDGNYELIRTGYTNESGVVDFGKMNLTVGKVVGSKNGYQDETVLIDFSGGPNYPENITVLLPSNGT